jgi:hypothetical protein
MDVCVLYMKDPPPIIRSFIPALVVVVGVCVAIAHKATRPRPELIQRQTAARAASPLDPKDDERRRA